MSKKRIFIFSGLLTICILFLSICFYGFKINTANTYKIIIHNNTNKTLENLELNFYSGNNIEKIEKIQPKKTWKYNLNTENINGEASVYLTYKDNSNNIQKACVVGYFEKGYSGKEKIVISNINKDGILEIN